MKILHVIPSVAPEQGGPSFVLRQLVQGLAAAGVDVDVVTTSDSANDSTVFPVSQCGVQFRYLRRQSSFYTFSWPMSRWLARNVGSYDLVHIHALFSFPSLAAAYWCWRCQTPYIVRPLGTLNRWGFENRRPWLKRTSLRCIEAHLLRHAAAVHYTSEEEKIEAERFGIRHWPVVIPNPYELPESTPGGNAFLSRFPQLEGRTAILFLSRLHPKKGLDLLLHAFSTLRNDHPAATLVIAGDGEVSFVAQLRAQVRTLQIADNVVWAGFLEGNQKRDALRSCAVFVLPSYSENFGVAVVEAMASGVPVIVSDQVAVHRDVRTAEAGLVCFCRSEAVADALRRILDDPLQAHRMGVNGAVFASEHYSVSAVTIRLIHLYQSILNGCSNAEAVVT